MGTTPVLYENGNSAHGHKNDDNPAAITKDGLDIDYIAAPSCSPDFNVIEHVWRWIKSKIKHHHGPQSSLDVL